jgi:hypothetical protein
MRNTTIKNRSYQSFEFIVGPPNLRKIWEIFNWSWIQATFENNRQVSLRIYAGTFLYNNSNSDFFSFALDRPTDYLFDYGYYGRSESSGFLVNNTGWGWF